MLDLHGARAHDGIHSAIGNGRADAKGHAANNATDDALMNGRILRGKISDVVQKMKIKKEITESSEMEGIRGIRCPWREQPERPLASGPVRWVGCAEEQRQGHSTAASGRRQPDEEPGEKQMMNES
jgi:hypothetical protein